MAQGLQGIKAGRAFVEIGAVDSELDKVLAQAKRRVENFGKSLAAIGAGLTLVGTAATAAFASSIASFAKQSSVLADLSERTGASVEGLSKLAYAARQTGTEISVVELAMKKASRTIYDASFGSESAARALEQLGLSAEELSKSRPDVQFERLATSLGRIENPTLRSALALEVFGKSGTQLQELSRDFSRFSRDAERFGLVVSAASALAGDELDDLFTRIVDQFKATQRSVGEALAPIVKEYGERVSGALLSVKAFAEEHQALIRLAAGTSVALTALGVVMTGTGVATVVMAKGVEGLTAAMVGLRVAAIATSGALGFVVAGIVAAGPAAAALATIGVLVAAAAAAHLVFSRSVYALSSELRGLREEGDRQRETALKQADSLAALSRAGRLSRAQLIQARKDLAELTVAYGDFGVRVDESTGRVIASASAFNQLADAMRRVAVMDVSKEIDEINANIRRLTTEINVRFQRGEWIGFERTFGPIEAERDKQFKLLEEAMHRRQLLFGGDRGALTGAPVQAGAAPIEDVESVGRVATDWANRVYELRLQLIENEHQRAITLMNHRYDEEVARAREAGAAKDVLANIESARSLELQRIQRDTEEKRTRDIESRAAELRRQELSLIEDPHERAIATIAERYNEAIRLAQELGDREEEAALRSFRAWELSIEAIQEQRRQEDRLAAALDGNRGRYQSIQELIVRATKDGVEEQRALLDLERERALASARSAGEDLRLVEAEYDLRRAIIEEEDRASKLRSRVEVVGGFDASLVARNVPAGPIHDTVAEAQRAETKKQSDLIRRLVERVERLGRQFEQALQLRP